MRLNSWICLGVVFCLNFEEEKHLTMVSSVIQLKQGTESTSQKQLMHPEMLMWLKD